MYHATAPSTTAPEAFIIDGGRALHGKIVLAGAKNAATKILLASLLTDEPVVLENVPSLGDTEITAELLTHVGTTVIRQGATWTLTTTNIRSTQVPPLSRRNRIPILALGPLLHRSDEVEVPLVGGDAIGPRPVDYHLTALKMMGAEIETTPASVRARTSGLHGTTITLPYPSVGATENIILAAVRAQGRTKIRNAAIEPEVLDLVQMLQTMGAIIELSSGRTYTIDGVPTLHGTRYRIMTDRNEAVSFACAALATNGDVTVEGARQADLVNWLNTVRRIGGQYEVLEQGIRFWRSGPLQAIAVETDTHPGFMTDWQQPLVTVLTQALGESTVHETVYEDRFGYIATLREMGASIEVKTDCLGTLPCRWWAQAKPHSARIHGPTRLHGAVVTVPDIRAGMAQVLAACAAEGRSVLHGVDHLDRGYQALDQRLQQIGARIERIPT